MKTILVPVFTEEYKIRVIVGTNTEMAKYISRNIDDWDYEKALEHCKETRGSCFNLLPGKYPLITLDSDLPYEMALATLPHEASHAYTYIAEYMGIDDRNDELRGHTISAVMRYVLKALLGKKKLYTK